jgi:hypothetical protein
MQPMMREGIGAGARNRPSIAYGDSEPPSSRGDSPIFSSAASAIYFHAERKAHNPTQKAVANRRFGRDPFWMRTESRGFIVPCAKITPSVILTSNLGGTTVTN